MRVLLRLGVVAIVAALLVVAAPVVYASCHSFSVTAPNTVSEGNTIAVKVERDAAINPSSVRVTTVSGSAESPSDFQGVNERVRFTNETSRTITIQTAEDNVPERQEDFAIRLSDGEGCAANPNNFQYESPERVTISDDDVPTPPPPVATPVPTTTPPTTAPTTAAVSPSPASPSPTATASTTPSPSPTVTPIALPIDETEDDFPWVPVGLGAAIVAAGAGALIFTRLRRGGAPGI